MENKEVKICGANGKPCENKNGCFDCKVGEDFRKYFGSYLCKDERYER